MKFGASKKRSEEEEVVDFKKFNIEDLLLDAVSKKQVISIDLLVFKEKHTAKIDFIIFVIWLKDINRYRSSIINSNILSLLESEFKNCNLN